MSGFGAIFLSTHSEVGDDFKTDENNSLMFQSLILRRFFVYGIDVSN